MVADVDGTSSDDCTERRESRVRILSHPVSGGESLQDDELLGFCILPLLALMASGITPGNASSPRSWRECPTDQQPNHGSHSIPYAPPKLEIWASAILRFARQYRAGLLLSIEFGARHVMLRTD
jgi:hypothetical protein